MMLLIDTHFVVWMALEPDRLSEAELQLCFSPENETFVSAASIWEIRLKYYKFRHRTNKGFLSPTGAINLCLGAGLQIVPLSAEACAWVIEPAPSHKDPFDEILLAQAAAMGARLLTRDSQLLQHPLAISV